MPSMLRAIINDLLAREPDFEVVGASGAQEDALLRARQVQADMLITGGGGGGSCCLEAILCGPPLSIVAIAEDGRDAAAVTLVRQQIDLEAADDVIDAIRRVAGRH
jgi:DNA-binding NarL/FixJ family response regulator